MASTIHQDQLLKLVKAICSRVKEKEGYLTKTKLIKYLYLIDVEYFRKHRKTFTGFNWVFYDFGPWAFEYNEIFESMQQEPEFKITQGDHPKYDTAFISCKDREEFDSVFENIDDELKARRIIDRWALEPLNEMLNYVYFKTEPMDGAERKKRLDFSKVLTAEPIPKFRLAKGTKSQKDLKSSQACIKAKIASWKATRPKELGFTPPDYDDSYRHGMASMEADDEY